MTAYNKFNLTVEDMLKGGMNFATDTIKVMLTNTAPIVTNRQYSDISGTELANGNGYTTGGKVVTGTGVTNSSGTETFAAAASTWTSVTGNMGPFRYIVYYNSTPTIKTLIAWYDYGSSITLNGVAGETFVDTPAAGALFTMA